jgi:DeoR family ulaG and ulaABCDEF operon transcriptional repressor
MHAAEREELILELVSASGFVSFRDLEKRIAASPATIRRDLERMAAEGRISRVRGGARTSSSGAVNSETGLRRLTGVPFHENMNRNRAAKEAIGRAAASLCAPGEAVMIDGGSTTLQMCPYVQGLNLQVLTNSLHVVSALLPQAGTRVLVPGGAVFREQNIILSAVGDELMPRYHAPKLFMGAAAVGAQGVMQADIVLVAAERRLIDRAQQVILLVDSSKFRSSSGNVVCGLDEVDTIVTDEGLDADVREMIAASGIELVLAEG